MQINEYFKTPIWFDYKPEFIKSLNKYSNKYIIKAKEKQKDYIKKNGDFATSYHSTDLLGDNNFLDFRNYIGEKSNQFLDWSGYDVQSYVTYITELWVQEFAKKGGGHHSAHIHPNHHMSGFYFLKSSEKTSYPIFHDPRIGALTTRLKLKDETKISYGNESVHFKVKPGTLIIFPSYLSHEFSVDKGIEPFRFIHWNMQAVPKEMAKDVV